MPALWKIFAPLLVLLLVALFLFVRPDGGEEGALRERGLQIREIDDPEGPIATEIAVAPEAVPGSMRERIAAPALALLPNKTGYPEMRGEIDLREKTAIKKAAENFLRQWETYRPGDTSYKARLAPITEPERLSAVTSRSDSVDPAGVCPEASCSQGSRWFEQNFSQSSFVIDQGLGRVYLVAYGAVVYGLDGNQERSSSRSYGILLRNLGGRWLVERAAAESLR